MNLKGIPFHVRQVNPCSCNQTITATPVHLAMLMPFKRITIAAPDIATLVEVQNNMSPKIIEDLEKLHF